MKLVTELLSNLFGARGKALKLAEQGRWLADHGKDAEAVNRYSESLSLRPHDASLYAQRAISYLALNDSSHALADINQSILLQSKNAPAYLARANIYLVLQRFDDCLADCDHAVSLLAWPQTEQMKQAKSVGDFADVLKCTAHCTASRAYIGLKNFDLALVRCRKALSFSEGDAELIELEKLILSVQR